MIPWFALLALLGPAENPVAAAPVEATGPTPLGGAIVAEDYPAAALRAREQGKVGFHVVVGADGRATACTVTASSGSAVLDSTTCRLLIRRARFSPARDEAGRPTTGAWDSYFIWSLTPG